MIKQLYIIICSLSLITALPSFSMEKDITDQDEITFPCNTSGLHASRFQQDYSNKILPDIADKTLAKNVDNQSLAAFINDNKLLSLTYITGIILIWCMQGQW